jgi:N-acetylglucosaminyl-diphospho-decaprenol L-rhamnosyltransferase
MKQVAVVVVETGALPQDFVDTLHRSTTWDVDLVQVVPTSEAMPVESSRVRMVELGAGSAYGAAVNTGVRASTAEFVVVTSPDIRWRPGSLDRLLEATRRWPTGATFGPLIYRADGSAYPSARAVPTLRRGIGHAVLGRWWPSNPWSVAYRGDTTNPVERTAGWLSGSCLLLRRDAFDSIGGFDPRFVAFFEDVDLGERMGAAGWHNVYVPGAVVEHVGVAVTGRESASMSVEHHRSARRYLASRYRGVRWVPLRLLLWLGLAVRMRLVRARRGASTPADATAR